MRTRLVMLVTSLAAMGAGLLLEVANAGATVTAPTVDYSGVEGNLSDALGPAVTAGLVILGIVAGVFIGIRLFKKVTGAKTA